MIRQLKWLGLIGGLMVGLPVQAADVVSTLQADGRFDLFAEALRQATDGDAERDEPLTVFAPSDEAFNRLPREFREALLAPANADALESVVGLHLVPEGPYRSTNIPVELTSASGQRIVVTYTRGALTLRPARDEQTRDPEDVLAARAANEGRIVTGDIAADNALIHMLDAVLIPPGLDGLDAAADTAGAQDPQPARDARQEDEPDEANAFVEDIADADRDGADEVAALTETTSAEPNGRVTVLPPESTAPPHREDTGSVVTLPPDDAAADEDGAPVEPDGATADNVTIIPPGSDTVVPPDASTGPGDQVVTASEPAPVEADVAERGPDADALELTRPLVAVSNLLGRDVEDQNGEEVGEVADILLSLETGRAETVVLSIDSGLLDLFGESVKVDTRAISIDPLGEAIIVDRNALNIGGE